MNDWDSAGESYHRVSTGKEPLTYAELIGGFLVVSVLAGSAGYLVYQIVRAVWS